VNFSVTWIPLAEARLTELWLKSRVSSQITEATDKLDAQLSQRPLDIGESRHANTRIAFERPLAILYDVDPRKKRVVVVDAWLF